MFGAGRNWRTGRMKHRAWGGPFVYLIRQEILEWVAIYVWVRQKKEGVKEERRKRQEGISLH